MEVFVGDIYRPRYNQTALTSIWRRRTSARAYLPRKFNQRWALARKQSTMLSIYGRSDWTEYVITAVLVVKDDEVRQGNGVRRPKEARW